MHTLIPLYFKALRNQAASYAGSAKNHCTVGKLLSNAAAQVQSLT